MEQPTALLVDGDQVPPGPLAALLDRLQRAGPVVERICVRNWRSTKDQKEWRSFADGHGFELIQRDPVATGKNASDIEVAIRAMDLLHRGHRRFCLVSGDTDFTPLVSRLRRASADVEWVHPTDLGTTRSRQTRASSQTPAKGASKGASKSPARAATRAAPKSTPRSKTTRTSRRTPKARPASTETGDEGAAYSKHVRKAIDHLTKAGNHQKGWVAVARVGSLLSQEGHARDAFGFAKSRPMHRVLEDLGFRLQQTETGAYEVRVA